jgi:hypothetical protein
MLLRTDHVFILNRFDKLLKDLWWSRSIVAALKIALHASIIVSLVSRVIEIGVRFGVMLSF